MKDKFNFAYATDVLIFAIDSRKNDNPRLLPDKYLSILLIKKGDKYCLPGGFVDINETSYDAALRVLKKETNVSSMYLEQLKTFDDVKRDDRGRVVSTAYMALVDKNMIKDKLSNDAFWFDIDILKDNTTNSITLKNDNDILEISIKKKLISKTTNKYIYKTEKDDNLMYDHSLIINEGLEELINKVNNTDIVFNLMPKEFTIGELKQVYELLLQKKLINAAFRRVIASKVTETNKSVKRGGFRPSVLFRYKEK